MAAYLVRVRRALGHWPPYLVLHPSGDIDEAREAMRLARRVWSGK